RHTRSKRDWSSDVCSSDLWDPVRSVVVTCYSATTSKGYGVFTLDSLDQKIHLDTPNLVTTDKDWARIQVHPQTGDYFLFVVASRSEERRVGKECRSRR